MTPVNRRTMHELERMRRSVAMLSPGQPGLDRDDALAVLAQLQGVQRELDRLEDGFRELIDGGTG